jgi:hypothetical protein
MRSHPTTGRANRLHHHLASGGKQQQPGAKTRQYEEQQHRKEKHGALHQHGPTPQTGHCIVGRSQRSDAGQIKCEGDIVDKVKPDLLAASSRAAQGKRILAQLEHGVRPPANPVRASGWTIDGWTIGLCALLLLMCSVAWLMHERRITPETFRSVAAPAAARPLAKATQPQPLASAPDVEQAAAIINVAAPELAAGDVGDAAAPTSPPTPTAVTAAIANSANASQAGPTAAAPATARAATVTLPRKASASAASAAAPGQAGNDTDVTLLTALVAHAGKPTLVTPERPRDVVERAEGDTTAQLLARCKQLGLIEGMLCRSRICSGRWETDAACRAPNH